jgi:hypothetical protein
MSELRSFWPFYGGKWRLAPKYPAPLFGTIVEPFAGAAGYALRYSDRGVVLVERDPVIAALWRYLIRVTPAEVRALPLVVEDVRALSVPEEARNLIAWWLNKGTERPMRSPSKWVRDGLRPKSSWGPEVRERIASQVERIRHWHIVEGDYTAAPMLRATWFVDPPYKNRAGERYRMSSREIDFARLGEWCRERRGQTIVCENVGATWLPFEDFAPFYGARGAKRTDRRAEAVWFGGVDG